LIIDRYLSHEILRPFIVGMGLLVVIFTGYSASIQLSHVESGGMQASTAFALILLNTLVVLEVLLPTALFFSVLTSITRLYRDSEMASLRAAGVSELRIVESVFKLAVAVAALVALVSLVGRPWAYQETYRLESKSLSEYDLLETDTGRFIDMAGSGYILFAKDVDKEQGLLKNVFLKSEQDNDSQLIFAQSARLPSVELGSESVAEFYDGYFYSLDRTGSRDITSRFNTMVIHLPIREAEQQYRRKAEPTLTLRDSTEPKDIAEYQARITSPLATIILAMLAVPLGRSSSRQTRFGSFFIAVVVYALSLSFVGVVRNWLEKGDIGSIPGMWLAYMVPAVLLILLLNSHSLKKLLRV
jgi:lipopolysaccharide export system permease protein